jgi:pyruvyltransferase
LALGSIFFALSDNDIVWGSGFLNAKHIQFALSCGEVNYLAVRGPETRKLLMQHNLACPEIYGDPAILLPQLIRNDIKKKYAIGVVPHFSHYQYFLKIIGNDDVKVINVENSLPDVIRNILSCEIILSTSLHGLIIAEAYGLPALMLIMDKPLHGDLFKFEDYFHSTNRSLSFSQFESSKISALADVALKQSKPRFDANKLLDVFPFKINFNLISPTLSWSNMSHINYKHSIVPPKFRVPL